MEGSQTAENFTHKSIILSKRIIKTERIAIAIDEKGGTPSRFPEIGDRGRGGGVSFLCRNVGSVDFYSRR